MKNQVAALTSVNAIEVFTSTAIPNLHDSKQSQPRDLIEQIDPQFCFITTTGHGHSNDSKKLVRKRAMISYIRMKHSSPLNQNAVTKCHGVKGKFKSDSWSRKGKGDGLLDNPDSVLRIATSSVSYRCQHKNVKSSRLGNANKGCVVHNHPRQPQPHSTLSSFKRDPFIKFPDDIDFDTHVLFCYCKPDYLYRTLSAIPTCLYNLPPTLSVSKNNKLVLFSRCERSTQ